MLRTGKNKTTAAEQIADVQRRVAELRVSSAVVLPQPYDYQPATKVEAHNRRGGTLVATVAGVRWEIELTRPVTNGAFGKVRVGHTTGGPLAGDTFAVKVEYREGYVRKNSHKEPRRKVRKQSGKTIASTLQLACESGAKTAPIAVFWLEDGRVVSLMQLFDRDLLDAMNNLSRRDKKGAYHQLGEETRNSVRYALSRHVGLQLVTSLHTPGLAGIILRDIKPENILLRDSTLEVSFADFGLATRVGPDGSVHAQNFSGTVSSAAPEQMTSTYGREVDLWGVGLVMLSVAMGFNPVRYLRREAEAVRKNYTDPFCVDARELLLRILRDPAAYKTGRTEDSVQLCATRLLRLQCGQPGFFSLMQRMLSQNKRVRPTSSSARMEIEKLPEGNLQLTYDVFSDPDLMRPSAVKAAEQLYFGKKSS